MSGRKAGEGMPGASMGGCWPWQLCLDVTVQGPWLDCLPWTGARPRLPGHNPSAEGRRPWGSESGTIQPATGQGKLVCFPGVPGLALVTLTRGRAQQSWRAH